MKPVVLITGLMRSGTSLVASMAHHLGYHAGLRITAPAPPSWRSDWEDLDLSLSLMLGREIDWPTYIQGREAAAEVFEFPGVCVKSPYLALRWSEVTEAIPERIVVVVERESVDVERSMRAHPQISSLDQSAIRMALKGIRPDVRLSYEEIVADPLLWARELASALSVDDEELMYRAAAQAGAPMEYA